MGFKHFIKMSEFFYQIKLTKYLPFSTAHCVHAGHNAMEISKFLIFVGFRIPHLVNVGVKDTTPLVNVGVKNTTPCKCGG